MGKGVIRVNSLVPLNCSDFRGRVLQRVVLLRYYPYISGFEVTTFCSLRGP